MKKMILDIYVNFIVLDGYMCNFKVCKDIEVRLKVCKDIYEIFPKKRISRFHMSWFYMSIMINRNKR